MTKQQYLPFRQLGNDLFADFECTCPSEQFKGTNIEHLMKTKIRLSGYNDQYFFVTVNKEPREVKCKCGKAYLVQWTPQHVIVNLLA